MKTNSGLATESRDNGLSSSKYLRLWFDRKKFEGNYNFISKNGQNLMEGIQKLQNYY